MGILEDLLGGGKPVTPGLLDAAGYMDPAQYDRARRSSAMDGLWAGLLAGGAPSLTPRNFFSALGTGMQGRQQYATDFDKDQLASSQAAAQRALIPQRQLELEQKRDALKLVGEKLPQLVPGYGGAGGGAAAPGGAAGAGGAGAGGGGGGGGRGGWGDHANTAIATLKEQGFSDAAIQGIMANGLAEGGFAEPWRAAAGGEKSYGPWQFHAGGELDGYLDWVNKQGGNPQDVRLQTLYAAKRAEEVHPGFKTLDDPKAATDIFATKFERYKGAAPGDRYGHLADAQRYIGNQPVEERQPIPDVGTRTLDQPAIASARPGFDTMFPDPSGRASSLGGPVPAAIAAGVPPPAPAPAPAATTPGAQVLTVPQGPAALPSAGNPQPGDVVDGLVFKGGDPKNLSNWQVAPPGSVTPGQGAALGRPDTVVPVGQQPQVPGSPGGPPIAPGGPAAMQLAALVSGGAGGQLRPGAAPGGDTVVPPGPLPAAPVTPAPAPAATQPPAGTLVPGAMPAMPAPAEQAIVPRPDLAPQPGIPERPTLTPAPAARPLPALPPAPGLTAPDFSQVGQAVPADVARRAGIALQVGLGLKILGLDVPAISKIAELPLELQKTAYEAAVKAPYELRNTQYQSLLNMNTEQWKNLSENDRTLWSAALGLDKTEFEARIRQSEKGVEEQNKQINQNWSNMTDAEKAKAAASNQFALAKYNAELTTAGEWNKPIQVVEVEPGTLRERSYTSTPAKELQKEIARAGGAPTGLTVGQALGAPAAPGTPATPAPAPGAVQPGMTPGSRFSKAGPGEQTAATGLAGVYVDKTKEVSAQADAAKKGLTSVDILLNAPPIDWQGKLAGPKQEFNRVMTSLFGVNAESVRSYEQASQLMGDTMRTALRASDPNPTDRQQQSLYSTLPSPERSREGYEVGLRYMAGMQDWQVYRNQQLNAHLRVNPNDPQGYFQKEDISGIPFIVARMRPQDRADYMAKVGRTDPAALTRLLDQLEQIKGASGGTP